MAARLPGLSEDERNELNKPDLNVNELRRMAEEHVQDCCRGRDPGGARRGGLHGVVPDAPVVGGQALETATKLLDLVAEDRRQRARTRGEFQKIMDCIDVRACPFVLRRHRRDSPPSTRP